MNSSIRRGDSSAFETFYVSQGPKLKAFARYCAANETDAEEILQEAVCGMLKKIREGVLVESPLPYLMSAIRNSAMMRKRKNQNASRLLEEFGLRYKGAGEAGALDDLARAELENELAGAFDRLGEKHRDLIYLHIYCDMTFEEIRGLLNEPLGTLQSRYHDAIKILQSMLKPKGEGNGRNS